MATFLAKTVRRSRAAVLLIYDRTVIPFWLRQLGIQFGSDCHFEGMPIIKLGLSGRIRLGQHVTLFSRTDSNPHSIPHPVILALYGSEARIEIGDYSALSGVSISARTSITIGKYVQIGPGACLWDNDGHALDAVERRTAGAKQTVKCGPIVIEDNAFIGARAMIMKNVTIGGGAIVGAGSIVTKNVNAGDIVAGNPAHVVSSRVDTPAFVLDMTPQEVLS
jgi:acetyltransferase-like isoleucine patch superfamily enzyme